MREFEFWIYSILVDCVIHIEQMAGCEVGYVARGDVTIPSLQLDSTQRIDAEDFEDWQTNSLVEDVPWLVIQGNEVVDLELEQLACVLSVVGLGVSLGVTVLRSLQACHRVDASLLD